MIACTFLDYRVNASIQAAGFKEVFVKTRVSRFVCYAETEVKGRYYPFIVVFELLDGAERIAIRRAPIIGKFPLFYIAANLPVYM
ncbi:MAG: hypothetical protein KatS3mg057_0730 [Herpetosiphonaceae bacterium]|nr:MAG: hypothetical protein KatS3mg057_0730 [Herpetosiphonaceae bacterium]